jgi:hypothetical protein
MSTSAEIARPAGLSWSVRAALARFGMILVMPVLLGFGALMAPEIYQTCYCSSPPLPSSPWVRVS